MGKIKSVVIIIVWFAFLGFIIAKVSAEEITLPIAGGVYRMITSPVLPEDPDPQVSLVDDLGPYDETQWRLFRYDPALGGYAELKRADWDPAEHDFDFGRGYWIISRNPTEIDIEGEETEVNYLTLRGDGDGWNQIGNIYLQDFTIGLFPNCNLRVTLARGGPSYQLNDVDNNPYTDYYLKEYIGGTPPYIDIGDEPGEVLETGKGYWLKNTSGEDVYLIFDPAGLTSVSTTNAPNFPGEDFFARLAEEGDPPDPPPGIASSSSVSLSGGSGGGGCFIATAAYGKYDHPKVQVLREFRDRYLLTSSFGRIFVDMYYRCSPTLAKFVADRNSMKVLARFTLMPMIGMSALVSKMNVYGLLIILAFPILIGIFLLIESGGGGGRCKPKFSIKSGERRRKR